MPIEPGTIVAFWGRGLVSRAISLGTSRPVAPFTWAFSPSHVGIMLNDRELLESTTMAETSGVAIRDIAGRAKAYGGYIKYITPAPAWSLSVEERDLMNRMSQRVYGKDYDVVEAAVAGTNLVRRLPYRVFDERALFCSELVGWILQRLGRVPLGHPARWTPGGLCRWLLRNGIYVEL